MAVKKKFPYRAAVVACNGGCRSAEGEAGCADGCIGCKACKVACSAWNDIRDTVGNNIGV